VRAFIILDAGGKKERGKSMHHMGSVTFLETMGKRRHVGGGERGKEKKRGIPAAFTCHCKLLD